MKKGREGPRRPPNRPASNRPPKGPTGRALARPTHLDSLTPLQISRAFHELDTYRFELEAQNEELRDTQRELDRSQSKYYDLYELAPVGYCTLSEQGVIKRCNLTASTLLRRPREDLTGHPLASFLHEPDRDHLRTHLRAIIENDRKACFEVRACLPGAGLAGEELARFRLEGSRAGGDQEPTVCRLALSDITDEHRLQEEVALAARMSSMGLIAASVAHEINNPLTFVLHNLERLVGEMPRMGETLDRLAALDGSQPPDGVASGADRSELIRLGRECMTTLSERSALASEGVSRIAEIVQGLNSFARTGEPTPSMLDPNRSVNQACIIGGNEVRARAQLVRNLGLVPAVLANEGKLTQVVLNLILNAAHAIPEGRQDLHRVTIETLRTKSHVLIRVSDTGCGILPENLPRVFEPFFTTRSGEQGSGLGLTISRKILGEMGGELALSSEPSRGTIATIRLPVSTRRVLPVDRPSERPFVPRARILVVDDVVEVRTAIRSMLEEEHEVVVAASGTEARELLRRDPKFTLILSDLMMPGLSGIELHRWLASHRPALARRVVFVTGGVFTRGVSEYLTKISNPCLNKPFLKGELLGKVNRWIAKHD